MKVFAIVFKNVIFMSMSNFFIKLNFVIKNIPFSKFQTSEYIHDRIFVVHVEVANHLLKEIK